MSDPANTAATAADPGKSLAIQSINAHEVNPPLDPNVENVNKDPLLKPNSRHTKKNPSVKSSSSKTLRQNSQTTRVSSVKTVGHSCRTCKSADNSRMVQCDECDQWHHYSCVGVDDQIAKKPWRCEKCEERMKKNRNSKQTKAEKVPRKKVTSKGTSEPKQSVPVEKGKNQAAKSSKAVSVTSATSRKSSRAHLELQLRKLEAEQTLLEEKKKLVEQQFNVLEELADLEDAEAEEADEVDGDSKVKEWLRDGGEEDEEEAERTDSGDDDHEEEDLEDCSDYSLEDEEKEEPRACATRFSPQKRSTPRTDHVSLQRRTITSSNQLNCSLSRSQLAARQVVAKDLPVFTGNPEEWPIFSSTFESTTRMCGYTDDENMIRLRNSLKGDAFAAVRSFLLHPSTVRRAMDALKLRFGQPQFVIHSLRDKVLAMPPLKADSMNKMIDFALAVQNLEATIDACGRKEYMRDISLLSDLVGKLPASMKLEWARHTRCLRKVNLSSFSGWIYNIAEDACLVSEPRLNQEVNHSQETRRKSKVFLNTHAEQQSWKKGDVHGSCSSTPRTNGEKKKVHSNTCIVCKGACASLAKCGRFLDLSYDGRWATIREARVCRKCLKQHKGGCESKDCGVNGCTFKHHPLLHKELNAESSMTKTGPSREEQSCNTHQSGSSAILFRYVPVVVYGCGIVVHCYAFLDDGSSLTLMDEELADELNLNGEPRPLCLKWTGGTHRSEDDSRSVSLDISGLKGKRFHLKDVRTVKELQLPCQTLDVDQLQTENYYLKGLPVQSYRNVRPRLLIGVQHANATLVRKSREGKPGQPIAIKTNLGWTIYGGAPTDQSMSMVHYTYHVCSCDHEADLAADDKMERVVKEYFSLESLGVMSPVKAIRSHDDERALKLLRELTHFNGERYETGLLWRHDDVQLSDNRSMALKRFYNLERRMEKDPDLSRVVKEKLADYVSKGYVRKMTVEELEENHERVWYLPVFPVTNPNKPGKVRLVWDAAATTNGLSLNSALLAGPDLLTPLVFVLYQFREFRFAVVGDIREMFQQVGIRKKDQHSQRYFQRDNENEISIYAVQVMTFGACCSPTSAQFVKNLNAERFSEQYPAAMRAIVRCTYVDDMLCSTETEQEAIELAKSVWFVHNQGGFEIRNWMSNSTGVLSALCGDSCAEKSLDLSSDLATEKVLGMWWCTQTDCFIYKINWTRLGRDLLEGNRHPTKREVLRTMMTIYDPLGLIAHYLIYLKVLLQEIWRTGVGWDEKVDQECFDKWCQWLRLLPEIEGLKIPRCYRLQTSAESQTDIQLHTFVDASESGMAAVAYLRFVEKGTIECSLVSARTRVAPLKYLTIPRMELQAALIGARLAHSIIQGLSIKVSRCVFWSDSRNALSWIRADHRKYSQFVAARASEILDLTNVSDWKWVPTKWNVADEGTKWQRRPSLTSESRWFKGPEFIWQREEDWPVTPAKIVEPVEEMRATIHVHVEAMGAVIPVKNFRNWRSLVRVTAYVFRFLRNVRPNKFTRGSEGITSEEFRQAEDFNIRAAQQDRFRDELPVLQSNDRNSVLPKRSSLYRLNPFLDEQGLLRMRGRTGACEYLPVDAINPIILPRDHPVTHLIVRSYHDKFHHRNHESVINEVRQKFCISRLRRVYAKIRSDCQRCKLRDARPHPPAMADLPRGRLAAFDRPFTHTGVDYFGPMEVAIGRRVEKRWGVLLTCLTTRAVHIELASSLTTNSCIMALRNFIARRGTPAVFYSDRGTNFIGSERELKQALHAVDRSKMAQEFVSSNTSWRFNPPAAPHMGGSWERLVQSVKRTLSELKLSPRPTDEALRNALIEVEGVLNARPLTHVPIEDEAAPALTPNHWLLGNSDGSKPWSLLDDSSIALRRGWHQSQAIANHFWRRWLREYLPEITRRSKWHQKVPPIKQGDIVLIADPDHPRNCWPKGRVIGTVNRDGQVRTVTIRTAKGVYERPAVKVAVLDVKGKEELADSDAESANWGGVSTKPSVSNAPQQQQPYERANTLGGERTPTTATLRRAKLVSLITGEEHERVRDRERKNCQ